MDLEWHSGQAAVILTSFCRDTESGRCTSNSTQGHHSIYYSARDRIKISSIFICALRLKIVICFGDHGFYIACTNRNINHGAISFPHLETRHIRPAFRTSTSIMQKPPRLHQRGSIHRLSRSTVIRRFIHLLDTSISTRHNKQSQPSSFNPHNFTTSFNYLATVQLAVILKITHSHHAEVVNPLISP